MSTLKIPAAAPSLWTAWIRDRPRSKWRCVVTCGESPDHALSRLEAITNGQYVESAILPAGEVPK